MSPMYLSIKEGQIWPRKVEEGRLVAAPHFSGLVDARSAFTHRLGPVRVEPMERLLVAPPKGPQVVPVD